MEKQLCRVAKDSNSRIYIVSNRVDSVSEGDYIMDESNTPFIMYCGYFITLDGTGRYPIGDYGRIEASDNHKMKVNRITSKFRAKIKDPLVKAGNVLITIRNKTGFPKTNERGEVMVKYISEC